MSVPGSNLLTQALQLIARQQMTYLPYSSRTLQANGVYASVYGIGAVVGGSIQPVSRSLMETLGLDMQRRYVNIFVPQSVVDVDRDVAGDQFQFAGYTYEALSITQWVTVDSWNQVLCVAVPT